MYICKNKNLKMKKYFYFLAILSLFSACDKKSKIEKAVEEIPMEMKLHRFEQAFYDAKPTDLAKIKAEYPDFFNNETQDEVWIQKMMHPQWRELYVEVEKRFNNFETQKTEIEQTFKHIKYYFPTIQAPEIYTAIGEMDFANKVIYAKNKLIIPLELYLGSSHKFYADFPQYISQNFEEKQMLPEVIVSFSQGIIPSTNDKSLLVGMIYYGKQLYLKDVLLPDNYSDEDKIGYSPEQIAWSKENESYIWSYFIEKQVLFSTDPKLPGRFLNNAPFSKFYLEIDNESPGRIGQWIGWQIVRSFMENNPDTSIQDLVRMEPKQIFEQSGYKPNRVE